MTEFVKVPKQSHYKTVLSQGISNSATTIPVGILPNYASGVATRFTIISAAGIEDFEATTWGTPGTPGSFTSVTRGLASYTGGGSTALPHPAGAIVILSNPWQLYDEVSTAIASKANIAAPTISNLTVTGFIDLPTYANAAARDVALPTPAEGYVVILLDDGEGNRAFSVYNGSSWGFISSPLADVTITGFLDVETGYLKVPVYANDAARDAGVPTPAFGMVIWNTTQDTLEIYTSSGWEPLDLGTVTPIATTVLAGKARLATDALVISRTNTSGGEPVVLQPSHLEFANITQAIFEEDLTAGDLIGVSYGLSDGDIHVSKAGFTQRPCTFPTAITGTYSILKLDETRIFVLYTDSATDTLYGVVGTLDIDANTLTFGSAVSYSTDVNFARAAIVDTDKVAVIYTEDATTTVNRIYISTISGSTITAGTSGTLFTSPAAVTDIQAVQIDTSKVAVFMSSTAGNQRVLVFTVSGTTVTAGTAVTPDNIFITAQVVLVKTTTDGFILLRGTSSLLNGQAATVATRTITLGSLTTIAASSSSVQVIAQQVESNKVAVLYSNSGTNLDRVNLVTLSGSTITYNTPVVVSASIRLCVTSTSELWVTTNEAVTSDRAYRITISGATLTIADTIITYENIGYRWVASDIILGGKSFALLSTTRWTRQGLTWNYVGTAYESGSRGETKTIKLKTIPQTTTQTLVAGQAYEMNVNGTTQDGTIVANEWGSNISNRKDLNIQFMALSENVITTF